MNVEKCNLVKEGAPATRTLGSDYLIRAVIRFLKQRKTAPLKILDVGIGDAYASLQFKKAGHNVAALGLNLDKYLDVKKISELGIQLHEVDVMNFDKDEAFDFIWASHIMEHLPNPGAFIEKLLSMLNKDAYLAIAVPPYKPYCVGGHLVTSWTVGQLMYFLAHYKLDVIGGHFINYGYNVFALVQKAEKDIPELLHDKGDIEILVNAGCLPGFFKQGIYSDFLSYNWFEKIPLKASLYKMVYSARSLSRSLRNSRFNFKKY